MTVRLSLLLGLMLAVGSLSAVTEDHRYLPEVTERKAMERELDKVFAWAGVRRVSDLQKLGCYESKTGGQCVARVVLNVDGSRRPFRVELEGRARKLTFAAFYPDAPVPSGDEACGIYHPDQDTIKDAKLRVFAVKAVTKFNRHLRWQWFSGPAIHREGRDLLVTYQVFSDKERERVVYVKPTLITFYVSPGGSICGALYSE